MATFEEVKARLIAVWESKLAFKEAAFRYCNHSKKRDKLWREIQELKELIAFLKGEIDL